MVAKIKGEKMQYNNQNVKKLKHLLKKIYLVRKAYSGFVKIYSICKHILIKLRLEIQPITNSINKDDNRKQKVIISLTSYPKRFKNLHLVIKSIMLQTVKPDKIILYLGNDSLNIKLPKKLEKLQKKGLQIEIKNENLKSHKKYYYAFQEFPNDLIITIDDDLVYENRMIELLLKSYEQYPNAISAKRVHRIRRDSEGKVMPYNNWELECTSISEPSMALFATTGAGTLFPPSCLGKEVFNKSVFMEECQNADDVWLKFMQILSETPVVFVKGKRVMPSIILGTQENALCDENVGMNMNDVYINNLEKLYGISLGEYS